MRGSPCVRGPWCFVRFVGCVSCFATLMLCGTGRGDVILSGGGLALMEQGGTFAPNNWAGASAGAIPFSSSDLGPELGIPFHVATNLNDEIYGNSNSWIGGGANPFPVPFAGIALDGAQTLQSIAFGRANIIVGGCCTDRTLGLYTLQYTTSATVNASTPDAEWTTIGTLDYQSAGGLGTNFSEPWRRHRYNFDPIANVTGIRLLVPATGLGGGTAIDEIELYSEAGAFVPPPPPPPAVVLTPAPGFAIGFNGNNGDHFTPAFPAPVPDNLALATHGSIPFSSSDLGPLLGIPFHVAGNLNDGLYGNINSWIGGNAVPGFAGISLDGLFAVTSIAWGRDNGNTTTDSCGGTCADRDVGLYTIQFTQVPGADASTPFTGNPATGWASIGDVDIRLDYPGTFDAHLRHEFTISTAGGGPIIATAFRLMVPATGLGGGTAIDEIELYGRLIPEPSTWMLGLLALAATLAYRRCRRS